MEPGNWRIETRSITNGKADPPQDQVECLRDELKDLAAYFAPQLEGVQAKCTRAPRKGAGNRFTIPIYVQSATPFQAMDLRLSYDAAATFVGASARGDATGALTSTKTGNGQLAISLASAAKMGGHRGSILLLQFRGASPSITLDGALIDEQPARVVIHRP